LQKVPNQNPFHFMADYQNGSCVVLAYVLLFENTLNQTTNRLCRPTVWDKKQEERVSATLHTCAKHMYVRTYARTHECINIRQYTLFFFRRVSKIKLDRFDTRRIHRKNKREGDSRTTKDRGLGRAFAFP